MYARSFLSVGSDLIDCVVWSREVDIDIGGARSSQSSDEDSIERLNDLLIS